jgi:subtilisin family serine protease
VGKNLVPFPPCWLRTPRPMKTARLPVLALSLLGAAACSQMATSTTESATSSRTAALRDGSEGKRGGRATRLSPQLTKSPDGRVEVYLQLPGGASADLVPAGASPGDAAVVSRVRARLAAIDAEQRPVIAAVEASGGVVTGTHRKLVNAVQAIVPVGQLRALAALPGVLAVSRVPIYERANTSAIPFTGGYRAWGLSGGAFHGKGVRIGVIDTGIDYTHADFGGPGTPEAYTSNDSAIVEAGSFPTAKVAGGRDFVGDAYDAQNNTKPKPDDDPLDCAGLEQMAISGGHGTHVAGTIAGQGVETTTGTTYAGTYDASVDPRIFRVGPGVAPEATLYALKVFGCEGSTSAVASALEWASDPNDDGDFSDRLDVINMSLGGSYGLPTPADQKQITNLTKLGTSVVVAAGNDGNTFFVTGSPATYSEVLSVAASTDTLSYATLTVNAPQSAAGDYPASEGTFTKSLLVTGDVTGEVVATLPALACSDLTNADKLAGKIALIDRGACTFVDKVARAQAAGAIAVLVVDSEDSDVPFSMGGGGGEDATIPGMMVRLADGTKIKGGLGQGLNVTLQSNKPFQIDIGADQMAGFSSRGPRLDDAAMKPEIAAPGVAISSAGVATGNGSRELQGTSMACPLVAGATALTRQAFPGAAPVDVKAALMNNTADINDGLGHFAPVSWQGAGRVKIDEALSAPVTAKMASDNGQVGVSFGAVVVAAPTTVDRSVTLTNTTSTPRSYTLSVVPTKELPGTSITPSVTTIEVPANGTAELTLSLTVTPADLPTPALDPFTPPQSRNGDYRHFLVEADGHLVLTPTGAATTPETPGLRLAYYGVVRAAGERHAANPAGCGDDFTLALTGETAAKTSFTSVFELGATYEEGKSAVGTILAIGAASDFATQADLDETTGYFAVALSKTWTTPAQGPLSLVGVNIDVDDDGDEDYVTFVEPRRRTGPYGDTIVATTYSAKTGSRVGQPRPINILPRDEGDTSPFNNDVLVLPVTATSLGLDPGAGKIYYQFFTQDLTAFTQATTDWVPFDLEHPAVDGSKGGLAGTPIYQDATSLDLHLDRARLPAESEGLEPGGAHALVLHHGNVAGKRFDVVPLPLEAIEAKIVTELSPPTPVAGAGHYGETTVTVSVRNEGPESGSLTITTIAEGATIVSRTSKNGSTVCDADASIGCTTATLATGETTQIDVVVRATSASPTLAVNVTAAARCFDAGGEETQSTSLPGVDPQGAPVLGGRVGGGFDCATVRPGEAASTRWPSILTICAAFGLGLARRRRR